MVGNGIYILLYIFPKLKPADLFLNVSPRFVAVVFPGFFEIRRTPESILPCRICFLPNLPYPAPSPERPNIPEFASFLSRGTNRLPAILSAPNERTEDAYNLPLLLESFQTRTCPRHAQSESHDEYSS